MGSLFSSPSVPSISPVSFVPTTTTTNVTPTTETPSVETSPSSNSEDAVKDVIKRTSRGRSSTIQTSFRGVLGETNTLVPQRKSLLGE